MRALETSIFFLPYRTRSLGSAWRPHQTSISRLDQVSSWAGEGAEYEFKELWGHLKYRFIDFIQVEYWACQEGKK